MQDVVQRRRRVFGPAHPSTVEVEDALSEVRENLADADAERKAKAKAAPRAADAKSAARPRPALRVKTDPTESPAPKAPDTPATPTACF